MMRVSMFRPANRKFIVKDEKKKAMWRMLARNNPVRRSWNDTRQRMELSGIQVRE